MQRRHGRSYYQYTESLILMRRDIASGRLKERIKLRETLYVDPDASGEWQAKEATTSQLHLGDILRRYKVQVAFPEPIPKDWRIADDRLVGLQKNGKPIVHLEPNVILQPLDNVNGEFGDDSDDSGFRIVSAYRASGPGNLKLPKGRLAVLEAGSAGGETDFCQHVVFVRDW